MTSEGVRAPRLRRRLVLTLTFVSAFSSVAVAATSYLLVARAREGEARRSALNEARFLLRIAADASPSDPEEMNALMAQLGRREGFETVAELEERDYRSSVTISPAHVPDSVRRLVDRGRVAVERSAVAGRPHLIVGAEIQPSGPAMFFFYPLSQVEADLAALRNACAAAALVMVLLSAGVGWISSSGLLLPVRRARDAARKMQEGILDVRLPDEGKGELAELARAFNEMAGTLQRSLRELTDLESRQRRFVADVSHELRTPLTALTAAVDVLEANLAGMNDAGSRAARLVITESRRLRTLTEDLMEMSRFDSGQAAMDHRKIDVAGAIRSLLEARGWSEQVSLTEVEQVETYADPRRLEAIVGNLVANAIVHGEPPVSVTVRRAGPNFEVSVADHGPGIPRDARPHVFERFYKADPARGRSEGSGLGLAIAHENAVAHGGRLEVAEGSDGTVFVLTIPIRSQPPGEAVTSPS